MRFLRYILGRSNQARTLLLLALIVGAVSGAASVGLLPLISRSLQSDAADAGRLGLLFAGLCVVLTLTRVTSQYLLARLGQGMAMDLRLTLSRNILAASLSLLERLGPHRLLAVLTDDVNSLSTALVYVPAVCINGIIVAGCLGYLAWLDSKLFLLLLVFLILGIVTYQVPMRIGMNRFRQFRQQEEVLYGHFRGLTEGVKELKLHRERRQAFAEHLARTADLMRRLRIAAMMIFTTAGAWGHLLFLVIIGLLLYTPPTWARADQGTLISYTIVLLYLIGPLNMLLDSTPNLGRADVAIERILQLGFSLAPEGASQDGRKPAATAPPGWQRLELAGAAHTYRREGQDGEFTLGPLDLTLQPGELIFLIGGNGSGKTTFAKLLVGLYAPEQGTVRLDGRPLEEGDLDEYRQLFSVVFADFYLFDRLLGLEIPGVDEHARRYLQDLQIGHKVEVREGQFSTVDLSQGQRKRLALLVTYLENRPIHLFDEWAADQDPVFKEIFYRQILLDLKRRGKTVIAISHDDRYFHLADRILKLDEGRLVYDGPPDGLGPHSPASSNLLVDTRQAVSYTPSVEGRGTEEDRWREKSP